MKLQKVSSDSAINNQDLIEIKKVASLFPQVECDEDVINNCLDMICAPIGDSEFAEKSELFKTDQKKVSDFFGQSLGFLAERCQRGDCDECVIKKWCNTYRCHMQFEEEIRTGFTYVDFFCGAGGLSLGFMQEGYRLSLANDIQKCCIETYRFNHSATPTDYIIPGDINDVIKNIGSMLRYRNVDVVVGGPPCQGFSMANRQRLIDDPRNYLYKSYIKAISVIRPRWLVMENVRGMLNVIDQIKEDYRKIGYEVTAHLLNAKDFGVPQNRERVIFIGNCIGEDNEKVFQKIYDYSSGVQKYVLKDALYGLRPLSAKKVSNSTVQEDEESGYTIEISKLASNEYVDRINNGCKEVLCFNHKARYNNPRDVEIFARLRPGDNSADEKIADIMPYKRREQIFKDKYYKLEPDKPCKTITAHMKFDCNMYIHPNEARGLTPREAARVQSYPDDYYFRGPYTMTYMQVGNSVPPLMSRAIAHCLKETMEGKNGCL